MLQLFGVFFFSAQRQQALWNLFSAWCQFLKESFSRSATFVITVEKPTLWLCPDKKKRNKKCFRSRLQELSMGKNHCCSGYTAMPHLMCGLLQGKFTWAILKQETVRTWVRPFLACLPAYLLTHWECVYICASTPACMCVWGVIRTLGEASDRLVIATACPVERSWSEG